MNNFGQKVKEIRVKKGLLLRQVAAYLEVDTALMSKFENGSRTATKEQTVKIATFLMADKDELMKLWLSDKIYAIIDKDEDYTIAEDAVKYILKNMKNR